MDIRTGGSTLQAGGDALFSENLFLFGDSDGQNALLQHPLGVALAPDGTVLIADSYNHKIKRYSPSTRAVQTVAGTGVPGYADGVPGGAQFSEPAGLVCLKSGDVLVADTNNNLVRRIDFGRGRVEVATVPLKGVPAVRSLALLSRRNDTLPRGTSLQREAAVRGSEGRVSIAIELPRGYHLTEGANSVWEAKILGGGEGEGWNVSLENPVGRLDTTAERPVVSVAFRRGRGKSEILRVKLAVYYCQDGSVCLVDNAAIEFPLDWEEGLIANVQATYRVKEESVERGIVF
jgi:hypothetical protein